MAVPDSPAALLARLLFHGVTDARHEDGVLARHAGPALLVASDGRVIAANLAAAAVGELLRAGHAADFRALVMRSIAENAARCENVQLPVQDAPQTLEASVLPVGDGDTALVLCRDVTLECNLRMALSESRERYKDLLELVSDFAWETDAKGRFVFVSPRGALGYAAADLIGRSPRELIARAPGDSGPDDLPFTTREAVENVQLWTYRYDGAAVCLSVSAMPLYDPAGTWIGARGICRDMTEALQRDAALWRAGGERAWSGDDQALLAGVADHLGLAVAQIANHEQLRDLSRTDGLTGLLNRRTFYAELERRWPRACRSGSGALIYCDLDNFKLVNDHFGHANGDETLRQIAEILGGMTRGRDLVARLGGDEFALWLEDADRTGAERKADGLLTAVSALANLTGDPSRPLAVSLGLALPERRPGDPESLEAFLARADAAMYSAKRTGKGRSVLAHPAEHPVLP